VGRIWNRIYIFISILLLIINSINLASSSLEACGYIDKVVDGDTIWIYLDRLDRESFPSLEMDRYKVRFADINAPEIDTPEGMASRDALIDVIARYGNYVCMDIDDLYIYDPYDRLVAVLFVPVNETHLLNINLYMVLNGYAVIKDYRNEFDPTKWSLYVRNMEEDLPSRMDYTYIALIIVILIVIIFIYRGRISFNRSPYI